MNKTHIETVTCYYRTKQREDSVDVPIENIICDSILYNDVVRMKNLIKSATCENIHYINTADNLEIKIALSKIFTDFLENLMKDYKPNKLGMKSLRITQTMPCEHNSQGDVPHVNILWHYTGTMFVDECDHIRGYDQYETTPFNFKTETLTNADRVTMVSQRRAAANNAAKSDIMRRYSDSMITYAHETVRDYCRRNNEPGWYINLTEAYLTYATYGATNKKTKD